MDPHSLGEWCPFIRVSTSIWLGSLSAQTVLRDEISQKIQAFELLVHFFMANMKISPHHFRDAVRKFAGSDRLLSR